MKALFSKHWLSDKNGTYLQYPLGFQNPPFFVGPKNQSEMSVFLLNIYIYKPVTDVLFIKRIVNHGFLLEFIGYLKITCKSRGG